MSLQDILGVATGLVFMWLVLSIAAMSLQEWIGNVFTWRSKDLENTIRQMLDSDEITKLLYEHPLISNLYRPAKKAGKKPRLPSYIPANKFALALFDILTTAGQDASPIKELTDQINIQLAALDNPDLQKLAQSDWTGILETAKQLAASPTGEAALDSLKEQINAYGGKYPEVQPVVNEMLPNLDAYYQQFLEEQRLTPTSGASSQVSMRAMRLGLAAIAGKSPKLKESVAAVLRSAEAYAGEAEQSIATARIGIETWFNDAMDRLSGTYKRRAQLTAFIIGFVLALILNVDSIFIATTLWREPTLRQAIVAEAQTYTTQTSSLPTTTGTPLQNIPALQTDLQKLNIPFGWAVASFNTSGKACSIIPFLSNYAWGIPGHDSLGTPTCLRLSDLPADLMGWITKLLGLAITAAATAQGAPFWFDILKKIVNVRSSGINPDEKQPVG
jgi:hypothetical protein